MAAKRILNGWKNLRRSRMPRQLNRFWYGYIIPLLMQYPLTSIGIGTAAGDMEHRQASLWTTRRRDVHHSSEGAIKKAQRFFGGESRFPSSLHPRSAGYWQEPLTVTLCHSPSRWIRHPSTIHRRYGHALTLNTLIYNYQQTKIVVPG